MKDVFHLDGSPAPRTEIVLTRMLLAAACAFAAVPLADIALVLLRAMSSGAWLDVAPAALAACALACAGYGVAVHHLARIGFLHRSSEQSPLEQAQLEVEPLLTILVPSYKEEVEVVRRTLLSAALQTYVHRRIVLLIDDPPCSQVAADRRALEAMRRLPAEVSESLQPVRELCEAAAAATASGANPQVVAALYEDAAIALEAVGARVAERGGHEARFFAESCVAAAVADLRAQAVACQAGTCSAPARPDLSASLGLAQRFAVSIGSFERKRYANLSHEPNKAMNLNAYLTLFGDCYRHVRSGSKVLLEPCDRASATVDVPESELVLFLDADTIVLPAYARRMVALLGRPGNERVAVAQTPYSAFPGAAGILERIAGATTDVQYLLHQGMAAAGAGFWVGANAVARVEALRDVALESCERGWPVRKMLHDSTVIEDTETTLALRRRGWSVLNHPERLAYSSTPADFGSLLVQRLRWANGGLTLVPSLLRALRSMPIRDAVREGLMRLHYLVSLGPTALGLLVLPFCFYGGQVRAEYLPFMTLSYFGVYALDLTRSGYAWHDVVRVYALNLLLIPVNLAGLFVSLRQAWTGEKPRFVRTPKVETRTPVPGVCIVAEMAMLCFWLAFGISTALEGHVLRSALVLSHVALLAYAVTRFVGWNAAAGDFLTDARANLPEKTAPLEGYASAEIGS